MAGKTGFVMMGLAAGAVIGFVTRPSLPLVGQLPFGMVITRGAGATGLDQLLVGSAQESFNHLFLFIIIGAACGFGVPSVLRMVKGELTTETKD